MAGRYPKYHIGLHRKEHKALIADFVKKNELTRIASSTGYSLQELHNVMRHAGKCYSRAGASFFLYDKDAFLLFKMTYPEAIFFWSESVIEEVRVTPGLFDRLRRKPDAKTAL
jgi:hypothetical protein